MTMHPLPKNPEKCPVANANINLNSLQSLFNGDKTDEDMPAGEKNAPDVNLLSQVSLMDPSKELVQRMLSDLQVQLAAGSEDRLRSEETPDVVTDSGKNKRSLSRQATKTIRNSNEALQSLPSQRTRVPAEQRSRKQSRVGTSLDGGAVVPPHTLKPTEPSSVAKFSNPSNSGVHPPELRPRSLDPASRKPVRSVSVHAVHEMATLVRDVDRLATNLQHRLFLKPKSVFEEYQQQQARKKREEKKQVARRLLAQREAPTRPSTKDATGRTARPEGDLTSSPRTQRSQSKDPVGRGNKRTPSSLSVPRAPGAEHPHRIAVAKATDRLPRL